MCVCILNGQKSAADGSVMVHDPRTTTLPTVLMLLLTQCWIVLDIATCMLHSLLRTFEACSYPSHLTCCSRCLRLWLCEWQSNSEQGTWYVLRLLFVHKRYFSGIDAFQWIPIWNDTSCKRRLAEAASWLFLAWWPRQGCTAEACWEPSARPCPCLIE